MRKKQPGIFWTAVISAVLLALGLAGFLQVALSTPKASQSFLELNRFVGSYSYDGFHWQQITPQSMPSAMHERVMLRGHFTEEIPAGYRLYYYRDHISISVYRDDECILSNKDTLLTEQGPQRLTDLCGREWMFIVSPGLTPEDTVDINLRNRHFYSNESAYREFLTTTYISDGSANALESMLQNRSFLPQAAGVVLCVVSLMLFGVTVASRLLHIRTGLHLTAYAFAALFAGAFLIVDIIDINFGCPVKKIAGRGAGSGMMRDVPLMVEMTRRIVEAVGKPVTVKTRLGWDDESKNIEEIALRLQDVGIAALTIHGRTRAQMYRGEADWTLIGKVKNNPRIHIPIIGNGDVDSGPKAAEMFDRYGVDGVMIGRATYGRPWIFREVKHYLATGEVLPQPSVCERVEIAKEHLRKSLEIKGEYVGILEMRRHLSNYFKGLPDFKPTRLKLVTLLDIPELFATLDSIAERWGDFDVSGTVPEPLSHDL